ncbi:MAG: hydrogenase formation protein HypD [Firmicutes bacterium HGW-Firmicutes-15]|nr:MAG: hydrogenase formation protein HypD [Firmicutes bacterium HGW-Firmicutes-15]
MKNDHKSYMQQLLQEIQAETMEASLMEVCGTHTMAIARSGIRSLVPPNLKLLSGPGCPVCVTAQGDIDGVIELVREPGITLLTFGDMMRVPGTESSLQEERSKGADIRVVYSPLDALTAAKSMPDREVVFLGIGFETTAPAVAITVEEAMENGIHNFSLFSLHKLVPPALEIIFSDPNINVDGLICPGHVAAVTGVEPYRLLAEKYGKPCVITGFEAMDILEGVVMLLRQLHQDKATVEIQYRRVVKKEGNLVAQATLKRVFQATEARWRGLSSIPGTGLKLRPAYEEMDARKKFGVREIEDVPIKGCACGEVLTGKITPHDCALFGKGCTPLRPIGPCMVSQEGACAAYYRYTPLRD